MKTRLGIVACFLAAGLGLPVAGCGGGSSNNPPPSNPTTPTVTVTPSAASFTTVQSTSVQVSVTGSSSTPTGTVTLTSGTYTSSATKLSSGVATIQIAAGTLAAGTDTLSASYSPDSASSSSYNSATGSASVTVSLATPTVVVTPQSATVLPGQAAVVTVSVSGGSGAPVATGSVTVSTGSYTSPAAPLASGSASVTIPAASLAGGNNSISASYAPDTAGAAIYAGASGAGAVTVGMVTPTVTVKPASASIDTQTALDVTVTVDGGSGNPAPTGSVVLSSGTYSSASTALSAGSAKITIPAGTLAAGSDTLTANYTPDSASAADYAAASGAGNIAVNKIAPTVTVTPAATSVGSTDDLKVTVAVAAPAGDAVPTGSVVLTSGTYTSSSAALSAGSATIDIPAGSLAAGSATIKAAYTPDAAGGANYTVATGTSASVQVITTSTVTVNQAVSGPAISDKLLGMNMADWYDPTDPAIVPAFQAAGIKAVRWPGGSWSDEYHWKDNSKCASQNDPQPPFQPGGWAHPNGVYTNIINDVQLKGFDVALTANYGTDPTCTKGGDPTEAADWLKYAEANGGVVSHITVGNEVYGAWEADLHAKPHDPATYATAVATGYYPDIKAVDKNVPVGVVVAVDSQNWANWDPTVLANAKYDFVEYHYYPQNPGNESDDLIVHHAAQNLATNIETLKAELKTAGKPDTPIYVGEIGTVSSSPGKQSWSITQGLYAGQALGEMMNEGVSRLTWWIGFGNCDIDKNGNAGGNMSSSLYGWQTFGAYNVFSDGPNDGPCGNGSGPIGTMSPTARAFQLFSNVAVDGESVLPAAVAGDPADVRAYAATHSGGTAIVLFNLSETTQQPVKITLSGESSSSDVKVMTYSKAIYDQSKNDVWASPTTTDLGAQTLPLNLWLDPWSMNVIIIK